jgi:hypothetical protein
MDLDLTLDFAGDVVERSELLNGIETLRLEGVTPDGGWTLSMEFTWSGGVEARGPEGDITLDRDDDGLFGSLVAAEVLDAADEGASFRLTFEVDGGSGSLDGGQGKVTATGTLAGDTFSARCLIRVQAPGAG